MNTREIWRLVPSQIQLLASSHGRIMVIPYAKRGRSYGGEPTNGQWAGTRFIYCRRGYKTLKVARLVCEAFHGPAPAAAVCMHLNEDARDNRPENLAWGTQKENLNAPGFIEYCRSRTGERNPLIKSMRRSVNGA